MTKSKISFAAKLFLTFVATNILIIAVIAILVGQNMRSGFSRYLLEVELHRFDDLDERIADHYKARGNWDSLRNSPKAWHDLVRQSMGSPSQPRPPATNHRPPRSLHPSPSSRPPGPLPQDQRKGLPPRPAPDPLRLGERLSLTDPDGIVIAGRNLLGGLTVRQPIFLDDSDDMVGQEAQEALPIGYLVLSAPKSTARLRDNDFLMDQFRNLFFASLAAILFSALAAFLLARGIQRPIKALIAGTRKVAKGDYRARMQEDRSDEFGQLIAHFNAMASSLEDAETAERQWLSDASHELKTPLAILRGRIEGIQDGIYQPDDALMAEMHHTIERLSLLVSDLNLLAHAREGKLLIHSSEENLSELVRSALDHVQVRLKEKGLAVEADIPSELIVSCDRIRIRQLLDNLLENARRYTEGPGLVRVSVCPATETNPYHHLIVEDSAPCPPDDSFERLFDRFFRTDPSRDRRSGGAGLGLAICRAIVLAHEGHIKAAASDLGGLKVTISLPQAQ